MSDVTYQVDFEPIGKRIEVAPNTTLLEAAQQAGLGLSSACGGNRSLWPMSAGDPGRQRVISHS